MAFSYQQRALGIMIGLMAAFLCVCCASFKVSAESTWSPTLLVNTEAFQIIDESNASANLELRFGSTLNSKIAYDRVNNRFDFTKSVFVRGNLTITGALNINSVTASGSLFYASGSQLRATIAGASGQILLSRGNAAPTWVNPTGGMVWYIDGTQTVGTSVGAQVTMPFALTFSSVSMNIKGKPTGAALIADIKKNGKTIFSTKPRINSGSTVGGSSAVFSGSYIPTGSLVTLDITQVGSTFAGSGLTIILNGTRRY